MSKTASAQEAPRPTVETAEAAPQHTRETIESVVIAIILAFLFRTFVAEAFVIPTGSMAPTLMGRHLDVECVKCGYDYRTGASVENQDPGRVAGLVVATTCPICRYTMKLDRNSDPNQRSFNGDRILVSKFTTDFERFDVIVFKYPGNAKQNYIKRLIGLPGEVVMIRHGNIYTTPILFRSEQSISDMQRLDDDFLRQLIHKLQEAGLELSDNVQWEQMGDEWYLNDPTNDRTYFIIPHDERLFVCENKFEITRKPPQKLLAMLQLTHDTRYEAPQLTQAGWPSRWQQWSQAGRGESADWKVAEDHQSFSLDPTEELKWLRYRHVVPWPGEWELIESGRVPERVETFPGQLITDYYPYNDGREHVGGFQELELRNVPGGEVVALGMHWVADLAMEAELEVQGDTGEIHLDMVAAGVHYTCLLDVATGKATLQIDQGQGAFLEGEQTATAPSAQTSVRGSGTYRLRLSNVDNELLLWVDGDLISFDGPTTYNPADHEQPQWSPDNPGDLEPLGIAAREVGLKVSRLRVWRDIYYISHSAWTATENDYQGRNFPGDIRESMSSPTNWGDPDNLFADRRFLLFALDEGQYLPLGDNSPKSKDARLWSRLDRPGPFPPPGPYVSEELLIGKALMIYWPHAWRRPIPLLPNFKRMGLIR